MKFIKLFLFLTLWFTHSLFAEVETITVENEGMGVTLSDAINNSILESIAQTYGKTISSEKISLSAELSEVSANDEKFLSSSAYIQKINELTSGYVIGYQILDKYKNEDGLWVAVVSVNLAKYKRNKAAQRKKIALMPLKYSSNSYSIKNASISKEKIDRVLNQDIANLLVSNRKFAILDRDYINETSMEKSIAISGNTPPDQMAKLGQMLLADYIIAGEVLKFYYGEKSRKTRTGDRVITTGSGAAEIAIRLIDVSTQQIYFSKTFNSKVSSNNFKGAVSRSSIINSLSSKLSSQVVTSILNNIYPLSIVSVDGKQVIIGQGGDSIKVGNKYSVYKYGKKIYDNYTKEYLGRTEEYWCDLKVTRVLPKISYGIIEKMPKDTSLDLDNAQYILRQLVKSKKWKKKTPPAKVKRVQEIKKAEEDEDW